MSLEDTNTTKNALFEKRYQRLKSFNEFLFSTLLFLPITISIYWFIQRETRYVDAITDFIAVLLPFIMFAFWVLVAHDLYGENNGDKKSQDDGKNGVDGKDVNVDANTQKGSV